MHLVVELVVCFVLDQKAFFLGEFDCLQLQVEVHSVLVVLLRSVLLHVLIHQDSSVHCLTVPGDLMFLLYRSRWLEAAEIGIYHFSIDLHKDMCGCKIREKFTWCFQNFEIMFVDLET